MKTYRGIIQAMGDEVSLEAGGIIARLEGNSSEFAPLHGLFATVTGEQQGDVIKHATLASSPDRAVAAVNNANLFDPVISTINANFDTLNIPGVLGIRPGFSSRDTASVPDPAIIVVTQPDAESINLPDTINGIPIEIQTATALEIIEGVLPVSAWEGITILAVPDIHYKPPPPEEVALKEMRVRNITCHIGPDSGWTTLKSFLQATTTSLTVAMYEFYAQHIIQVVNTVGEQVDASLDMILQVDKNDKNIKETLSSSWGSRLDLVKASVTGANRIFNNSYHTKVAVRDSNAFWLSSGNWSPSSQPVIQNGNEQFLYNQGNREWHVIIEDGPLAVMYEKFIKYDMKEALAAGTPAIPPALPDLLIPESFAEAAEAVVQPHGFAAKTFAITGAAVRVKPLMSPDNYAEEVLSLIKTARRSLYLQFSYIRQPSTEKFDEIISAIAVKMNEGVDVRVIVGTNQNPSHSDLLIGAKGWKRNMFRRQKSKLHNKGILIDGKIAVVGSNNWSSDGTQYNRDTSLVFFSRAIAQYFTEVFMFDWNNLTVPIAERATIIPVLAPESGPTPPGMIRIPWQAWFEQ